MSEQVLKRFTTSRDIRKTLDVLAGFIQNRGEPLKIFLDRFNKLSLKIVRLKDNVVVHVICTGLRKS